MPTNRAARIVVVGDEDNITFLLDATLRHFGYEVHVAKTGREALALVGEVDPDLVLLDVMLPALYGFEGVRRLPLEGSSEARRVGTAGGGRGSSRRAP